MKLGLGSSLDAETFEIIGELVTECHETKEVPPVLRRILQDLGPDTRRTVEAQIDEAVLA